MFSKGAAKVSGKANVAVIKTSQVASGPSIAACSSTVIENHCRNDVSDLEHVKDEEIRGDKEEHLAVDKHLKNGNDSS